MLNEKIMSLEELDHELDRLEAVQACRNLMGKYAFYHTAFRNIEYVNMWARREDTYYMFPFGEYFGWDGVEECYVSGGHGDRSVLVATGGLNGSVMFHEMDTECIEVADDCQTAKGVWMCPGHETHGDGDAQWCWGCYEVEFIQEDGVWKIWHMTLAPIFKQSYYDSWAGTASLPLPAGKEKAAAGGPPPGAPGGPGGPGGPDGPGGPGDEPAPGGRGGGLRMNGNLSIYSYGPDAVRDPHSPEPPVPYADVAHMPHPIHP